MSAWLLRPLGASWKLWAISILLIAGISASSLYLTTHVLLTQILVFGLINIISIWAYLKKNKTMTGFTSVTVMFVFFFFLYGITYPLDALLNNASGISEDNVISTVNVYLISNISLVGGIFFSQFFKVKQLTMARNKSVTDHENFLIPSLVLLFIGISLMLYDQYRLGGLNVIGIENRMNNFIAQRQSNNLALPWKMMITAAFFGWAQSVTTKKQMSVLFTGLILLSLFYFFGLGSRSLILMTILPAFSCLLVKKQIKLSKTKKIIIVLFVISMMSPIFNNARQALIQGKSYSSVSEQQWSLSEGETGTAFQITNDIKGATIYPEADPSYLTGVLYFLPSSIYQFIFQHPKPMNMGDWYVWYFHPYTYKHGGGMGFSPVAQAWMNGELFGVVAVFFILGVLLFYLDRSRWLKYLILPFTIWFQRSSFHSVMTDILFIICFFGMVYIASILIQRPHKKSLYEARL
ncbi:O-antigen polysaccharide polymerase Wzy [Paenibacillus chitinolyticus]|uniref:O-antigen polysaccharide polymerase Wzy n=1 Tax=Paenibacillus chitinolyticus TaxID=79263 RepID=UPI0036D76747